MVWRIGVLEYRELYAWIRVLKVHGVFGELEFLEYIYIYIYIYIYGLGCLRCMGSAYYMSTSNKVEMNLFE